MRALITGVTGMDGSHLADLLLAKGYEVHGLIRRCSHHSTSRIDHIKDRIVLHEGDLLDQASLDRAVTESEPDEVYNLAAQSFVGTSWQQPEITAQVTGLGALRLLEAIRQHAPNARIYQASSSEMFGNGAGARDESVAVSAAFAVRHGEGVRPPHGDQLPRVARTARVLRHRVQSRVRAARPRVRDAPHLDAGRARPPRSPVGDRARQSRRPPRLGIRADYVEAMWLMLQQDEPADYVLATGEMHSVREFLALAVGVAELDAVALRFDPALERPADIHALRGSATLIREKLGWRATHHVRGAGRADG